jgi:hypothetical protein
MYVIRADILKDGEICDNAYFCDFDWTYSVIKATRFNTYEQAKPIFEELEKRAKDIVIKRIRPCCVYEIVEIDF